MSDQSTPTPVQLPRLHRNWLTYCDGAENIETAKSLLDIIIAATMEIARRENHPQMHSICTGLVMVQTLIEEN